MTRNPTNEDEYQSPFGSIGGRSVVHFDGHDASPSAVSSHLDAPFDRQDIDHENLRRRRSSITMRLNSLAQVGGVNSIENFAKSWQRAAGFFEVTPRRPSFVLSADHDSYWGEDDVIHYGRTDTEYGRVPRASLLRAHLEASSTEIAVDDESIAPESDAGLLPLDQRLPETKYIGSDRASIQGSGRGSHSIFAIAPHLATPLAGSYGTSYGTLHSAFNEPSMVHAGQLWKQQQAAAATIPEGEVEPLIVKEVEQDGKIVLVVAGQSTLPQTIFNSTNVLIGVGLLSLPMGIKYSGWICGMTFLLLSAIVTAYTARLLAKCMDADPSLITFADLAFVSYGQKARIATSVLFSFELLAACVALIVLFADTLHLLIPAIAVTEWKILCGILLVPLTFVPLRLLSFSSVIGILSCFSIVLIVLIDGFLKPHTPGSLREPAPTYLFPSNWLTLPLSFGLLMFPWGGHSVFPNIYRDMRHPVKFKKAVKVTFTFTYLLDCATAVIGILMFGDGVMVEISANILDTAGYPRVLTIIMSVFIAIIPLTKLPLNARPIFTTIELICGLEPLPGSDPSAAGGLSNYTRGILKGVTRVLLVVFFVVIAVIFPAFDSIMAFMGSTLCFSICVILPLLFYLKIFGTEISVRERILDYVLIFICSIMATVGTVWAFLPKSLIGAE